MMTMVMMMMIKVMVTMMLNPKNTLTVEQEMALTVYDIYFRDVLVTTHH